MSSQKRKGLRDRLSRRLFRPGILDFVFNPVFLIRRPVFGELKRLSPHIGGMVLDFGCGSMPYKDVFKTSSSYVGLDLATSQHGLSQPDVLFDGERIPFDNETFDSVVSFEVLDDLSEPDTQLAEIRRVLKPGGSLLLSTTFVWELHEEPHDIARYTQYGLEHLLERNGFEVVTLTRLGHYLRVIGQMSAMYWYQTLQKIPLGIVIGVAIAALIQMTTLIIENIFPKRRELWLSTVVLAKKIS